MNGNKILLSSVILCFLIGMLGIGIIIRGITNDVQIKDLQINVLADELGNLKEENQYLYENILSTRDFANKSIQAIQNSIENQLKRELSEKDALKSELNNIQNELNSQLNNKELSIEELKERNNSLSSQLDIVNKNVDVTNILILGTNQKLTDTIIIASINPSVKTISLISVPRDLWVNGRKVNSILARFGMEKLLEQLHSITGLSIEKYAIVDFNAFINIVDILGGIDLYVREDIYDPYFPTASNGYTVYSIKEGSHHLDGEEALMYARSRKTTSDFDRSKRQQQVIQAVRVKLKKFELLDNLNKAMDIYNKVISKVDTNIDVFEALFYLKNYQNYAIESNNVLSTSNLLYSTKSMDGQYILLSKSKDYFEIQRQISKLIND